MSRNVGRIGTVGPWYVTVPLDFERPEAQQANQLLATAYVDRRAAIAWAESVSVSLIYVNREQPPFDLIRDIMRQAAAEQRLEQLLKAALSDQRIAAYHPQLVALMPPADDDARVRDESQDRPRFVLVAGSGGPDLPETIAVTSECLGRALAEAGFGLVTCGWQGVDATVANAFARTRQERGARVSSHVLQVVPSGTEPAFAGGNTVVAASEDGAWQQSIEHAEAVVLIGGVGGTYETGKRARTMGKPVLPLAGSAEGSHDDARRFHAEMRQRWQFEPVPGLTNEDFIELASPIPGVIPELIRCLRKVLR